MIRAILRKFGWGKRDDEPKVVSIDVSEDIIREKMKESRDFRMKVTEEGEVSAYCKGCESVMFVAQDEMLVWLHCTSCNRYSFDPHGNVKRNTDFAIKDGSPLECEGFFIDLPSQLQPPSIFDSTVLRTTRA